MTIKERAKHFAYEEEGRFIMRDWTLDWEVAENGYATGATEQQEIDIQRAVEWLKGVFLEQYLTTMCSGGYETNVFNDKFFSDFKQAMKGE